MLAPDARLKAGLAPATASATELDAPRPNSLNGAGANSLASDNSIASVNSNAGTSQNTLKAAAENFEALFLQQVLKQMRKATSALGGDNSFTSREQATLQDFYDEALAKKMAGSGQTGLRDLLVAQLSGRTHNFTDAAETARAAPLPAAINTAAHSRPSLASDNSFLQLYRASDAANPGARDWRITDKSRAMLSAAGNRLGEALSKSDFYQLVKRVIKQESAGRSDAVSPKGALGLMQLMPSTAREMASEQGLPYSQARLTQDPHYNVKLGTAYLQKMLARYDQSAPLALAAYNAGPGRVDQWLEAFGDPRTGAISERQWMQAIPIAETRAYTQSILRDFAARPAFADTQVVTTPPAGLKP